MDAFRRQCGKLAMLAMLGASVGCQTHIGGMTLPSPYYLKEKPDYITPASQFPLPNELHSMKAAAAQDNVGGGQGPGGAPMPMGHGGMR
jgi:hypothetical protein